mmetsp:Transcript_81/g.161  ORF Transcript_81/g.161 Transcript_81/m.161 type:complete len:283 (+) Transcript_81:89-937(+)
MRAFPEQALRAVRGRRKPNSRNVVDLDNVVEFGVLGATRGTARFVPVVFVALCMPPKHPDNVTHTRPVPKPPRRFAVSHITAVELHRNATAQGRDALHREDPIVLVVWFCNKRCMTVAASDILARDVIDVGSLHSIGLQSQCRAPLPVNVLEMDALSALHLHCAVPKHLATLERRQEDRPHRPMRRHVGYDPVRGVMPHPRHHGVVEVDARHHRGIFGLRIPVWIGHFKVHEGEYKVVDSTFELHPPHLRLLDNRSTNGVPPKVTEKIWRGQHGSVQEARHS